MIKHKWWCHFQLNFSVLVFFCIGWLNVLNLWIENSFFFWVMQGMNFLDGCWVTNCLDCRGWYHSLLLRFEGWGGPIKKACLDILFAWNFFEVRACLFCIRSGKFKIEYQLQSSKPKHVNFVHLKTLLFANKIN